MQISRLFEIVYILVNRRQVTAKELAERFEVSIRTIYRDIDALSAGGVPVYTKQGIGGGICIDESYVLSKAALNDEEQRQILMALKSLAAPGQPGADALVSKLGSLFGKEDEDWIEVDFTRWGNEKQDQHTLATIKEAILGQRHLSFTYYSSFGEKSARTVSPKRLVYKARSWYLEAYCHAREAYRIFKIFRMGDVRLEQTRFDRALLPPTNAVGRMPEAKRMPPPFVKAVLRFQPRFAWRVWDEFDPACVTFEEDGSLVVNARLQMDDWLVGYLLSLGTGIEVLSPPPLKETLVKALQEMLERHTKPDV